MKDERIVQTNNKIWGELGKLVYYFVVVAFFVKIIFLQMKLNDCVVEYTILIGAPVYHLTRSLLYRMDQKRSEQLNKEYEDTEDEE